MHVLTILLSLFLSDDPPLAIQGADVVVEPGKTIANATIVIRHGLIESVGTDVKVPADAEVIDGKGLIVYAGFIDAHARFGLPETKLTREQIELREGEKPDFTRSPLFAMQDANRKGLRPELLAAEIFAPAEGDVKKWQAAGFAAVVTAVDNEYLSGASAVVSLNGGPRRASLLSTPWAIHASFRTYGEGYPKTLMGVLAHLRQFFHDALNYQREWVDYRKSPRGKRRPPVDPALEAALPLLDGRRPVVFEANTENEIHRALDLAEEFGMRIILSGGAEADKVALRLGKVPVLLSLKFPEEPKKRKDDDRPKKLIEEEKRLWENRVRCAIALHEAKVTLAFTTFGMSAGDMLDHVRKLAERGLPLEAAVRALTQTPAEILGLAELGTIEPGKIANLTVLTAPLGEKKAKVRYLIADGRKFEFDVKKAGGAPPEIDLSGKWSVSVESPKMEAVLELKQAEGTLTGKLVGDHGDTDVTGSVSGRKFTLTGSFHGSEFRVEGELKDEKLTGTVRSEMGESEFTGTKPEGRDD